MKNTSIIYSSILFLLMFIGSSCKKNEIIIIKQSYTQYADHIIDFSSEYNLPPEEWSSIEVLGEPDTYPQYGDIGSAWASESRDGSREYLELGFDTIQTVNRINIYETYNPGAIDTVFLRNADSKIWNKVWQGTAISPGGNQSNIFKLSFPETQYPVDAIRIAINSPAVLGWNEIDAVSLEGYITYQQE